MFFRMPVFIVSLAVTFVCAEGFSRGKWFPVKVGGACMRVVILKTKTPRAIVINID